MILPPRLRLLHPRNAADLEAEMRRVECHPEGIRIMLPKARLKPIKIEGLSAPAAHIIKQSALSVGGDAAVHRKLIRGELKYSDAILLLTESQIAEFCERLQPQDFGLSALAARIRVLTSSAGKADLVRVFKIGDRLIQCGNRPLIMGILNVTPDSFSDGGRYLDLEVALQRAQQIVQEGADLLDVGGESSRPGAEPVSAAEELRRVLPVIERCASEFGIPISIDTVKAEVAAKALQAGARIVNDISALRGDADLAQVVADQGATLILMHMQGEPQTMQQHPHYHDLIGEINAFLEARIEAACSAGVERERIIVDPGVGFGKRWEDNFEILGRLREFHSIAPVLVGPSRKSFIGKSLDLPPQDRLEGTIAAVAVATLQGADVIRVHDVGAGVRAAVIAQQCMTLSATSEVSHSR